MKVNDHLHLRASIEAKLVWREPPQDAEETMLRAQAEIIVAAMAKRLETGVEKMLLELCYERQAHYAPQPE